MFGGTKPGFGANTGTTGFGTFGNTANTSPFGQSTFGKPATTGFSSATPVFGAATQNTSLFGATSQPTTGLFGAPTATPAFGAPATTQSFGFGQTGASTSLFGGGAAGVGGVSNASVGGGATSGLFGSGVSGVGAGTSAFGQPAKQNSFGFGVPNAGSAGGGVATAGGGGGGLFGQPSSGAGGVPGQTFGQAGQAGQSGGLFGNTGFSSGATTGTVIKFNPVTGSDMMVKSGQSTSINTKHHCITCMKEYEGKSLEELRLEDYMANRKGPQSGGLGTSGPFGLSQPQTGGGLFGQQNAAQQQQQQQQSGVGGGMFGQPENKPLFGAPTPTLGGFGSAAPAFGAAGQTGGSSLFGAKPVTGFGAAPASSSTTSAFSFNANTFGANTQAKPFGAAQQQTTGLFGQPATSTFGTTNTGFGAFGAQSTQSGGLFGAKPAGSGGGPFQMPAATNTGFGAFVQTSAATTAATPSLFGAKPGGATGFGTTPTGFGASTTSTGFGGFGHTANTGSLFNNSFNKPANTNTFGFGNTNTSLGTGLNLGGTSGSLFGGNAAAKPGGLFGSTNTTGATGLFGNTNTGGAFGTNAGGLSNTMLGNNTLGSQPAANSNIPIHQQLILMSQPFGDSPLFRNLAPASGKVDELLRPTNPAAQKAVLDSPKYKLSPAGREVKVKLKPLSWSANPKKTLFDGLEESDPSMEAFTLKPNPKRLVLKSKVPLSDSTTGNTNQNNTAEDNNSPGNTTAMFENNHAAANELKSTPAGSLQGILSRENRNNKSNENQRRVSWLNTSTLDRERNRKNSLLSDQHQPEVFDNTLSEFAAARHHQQQTSPNAKSFSEITNDTTNTNDSLSPANANATSAMFGNKTPPNSGAGGGGSGSGRSKSCYKESDKENLSGGGSNTSIELSPSPTAGGGAKDGVAAVAPTPHYPSGITLTRSGYYTIPALDKLADYMSENREQCIVPNFTVGREGYGNVYFNDSFDVANLNLDEIVHFRHKEVVIYPDDDNKPPVGQGLNRRAQVTLDRVWPHDKTRHEPITDPDVLQQIDYEEKLRRVCAKHDTRFLEYRPQTGSWVFKVDHFSKYGLSDSEDEEDVPSILKKQSAGKPKTGADINSAFGNKGQKPKTNQLENGGQLNKLYEDAQQQQPKGLGGLASSNGGDPNGFLNGGYEAPHHERSISDQLLKYPGIYAEAEDDTMQTSWLRYNNAESTRQRDRGEVRSPTADVAKVSGTNSHKLQLMKASFFADDDEEIKSNVDAMDTYERSTPDQTVPKGPVMRSHYNLDKDSMAQSVHVPDMSMSMSESLSTADKMAAADLARMTSSTDACLVGPRAEAPVIKPTTVILQYQQLHTLPYQNSICHRLQCGYLADAALFNGRRFRAGWGPRNTLLTLTTNAAATALASDAGLDEINAYLEGRKNNDRSPAVLQTLKIGKVDEKHFKELAVPHLESQLESTRIAQSGVGNCPKATTEDGAHESHHAIAQQLHRLYGDVSEQCQYNTQVWDLVHALWGHMETLEGIESSSHLSVMCRRKAFSEWLEKWSALESTTTSTIDSMTDDKDIDDGVGNVREQHLYTILDLLSQHKVSEACEIAQKNGDYYLSMLLSQISSGPVVRELMKQQLVSWKDVDADVFVSPLRLRVFLLVAGVALFESSHGLINICSGLDWKRALAVHLWYVCMPTGSITDCLQLYENAFDPHSSIRDSDHPPTDSEDSNPASEPPYACAPDPPYDRVYCRIERRERNRNSNDKIQQTHRQTQPAIKDLCYHLLKLYARHSYPLECLLNPATHSPDAMDYRLSWFLQQSLHSLGFGHSSELSRCTVHASFAAQLEANGLWHWAAFVLLHMDSDASRERAVTRLLDRHVSLDTDEDYAGRERFLLERLRIPGRWLYASKAQLAGSLGRRRRQAECLMLAGSWNRAHDVIMRHLAPEDFVNGDMQSLRRSLEPLAAPENSCAISGWTVQGQILWDYLELEAMVRRMLTSPERQHGRDSTTGYDMERLSPKLSSLCSRISLLPCPSCLHALLQSELSKRVLSMVRGVIMQTTTTTGDGSATGDVRTMLKIMDQLPMPEDYAQHELRSLIDNFPKEFDA